MSASFCVCGHWKGDHAGEEGNCGACECAQYEFSPEQTREAFEDDEADRLYDAMIEYDR